MWKLDLWNKALKTRRFGCTNILVSSVDTIWTLARFCHVNLHQKKGKQCWQKLTVTLAFPESPEEIIFTIPLCGYKTHVCISSISFAPTFLGEGSTGVGLTGWITEKQ